MPDLQVEAALVAELGPSFLESNPEVAFHLQRCQFGQLVEDGHTEQALRLLRHSMAPIALKLQHLQPCLKVENPAQDRLIQLSLVLSPGSSTEGQPFIDASSCFRSREQDRAYDLGCSHMGRMYRNC